MVRLCEYGRGNVQLHDIRVCSSFRRAISRKIHVSRRIDRSGRADERKERDRTCLIVERNVQACSEGFLRVVLWQMGDIARMEVAG